MFALAAGCIIFLTVDCFFY